jgi:hypothetical protein
MNIYIIFDKYKNIPIFDLEIFQEEDCLAKAKLVIEAGVPLPPAGTEGRIQGDTLLFKGVLVGVPTKMSGYFANIELIARPLDFSDQMERLQKDSRIAPYWDALWVKNTENWEETQDVHTSALYCDRRYGTLTRSDWFEGRTSLTLGQAFFQDSLQMKLLKSPLKACTVNVHAHWVQQEEGITNLSGALRLAFPQSQISTYTKDSLLKKWPESGQRIGRSGLWVVKSGLKETHPPSPFYRKRSPTLLLSQPGKAPAPYLLKRHWFNPTLWVGWRYHQKRKETLSVTLHHAVPPLYPGGGEHKVIDYTLQNINPDPKAYIWRPACFYREGSRACYKSAIYRCNSTHTAGDAFEEEREKWTFQENFYTPLGDPARASFFLTDRGYLAAEHAMERAKAQLAKSARALEVCFEAPWDVLKDINTDTSVELTDPRLPSGKARGKVVKYALIAKGDTGERFGRVTLLCSTGRSAKTAPTLSREPAVIMDDYCENAYQAHENAICQTPSGLQYFRYDHMIPPEKSQGPLLRGIELTNGPDVQEEEMLAHGGGSPGALTQTLSQKPTRLRLHFKDLRTKDQMEHVIPVRMAAPWGGLR